MKTNAFLIVFAGFALISMQTPAQDIISNMEIRYKFDYAAGDAYLKDYSGNNRHIAPSSNGIPQDWSSMQFDVAQIGQSSRTYVYFPAGRNTGTYFSLAPDVSSYWQGITGTVARTFCAWFKIDADAAPYDGKYLFSYGNESQPGGGYRIELKGSAIEFANAQNTGANNWCNRNVAYMDNFAKDAWHHLALVYDGLGGRQTGFTLYVDGNAVAFDPVAGTAPDYAITTVALYDPEIGRYMERMAIADVRFYSRALTSTEVNLVKNTGEQQTVIPSSVSKAGENVLYYQNHSIVMASPADIGKQVVVSVYNSTGQLEQKTVVAAAGNVLQVPCRQFIPGIKTICVDGQLLHVRAKLFVK